MFFRKRNSRKRAKEIVREDKFNCELSPEQKFELIPEIEIGYIGQKRKNVFGLTESEIMELEHVRGKRFPRVFRLFLANIAGGELKIFDNQDFSKVGITEAHEVANVILEEDGYEMSSDFYPFSQWQGYQFFYFIDNGEQDPPTYLYIEGGDDPQQEPPEVTYLGSFSDWLLNLTHYYLRIYSDLEGHDVKEAEQLLKPFLKINA